LDWILPLVLFLFFWVLIRSWNLTRFAILRFTLWFWFCLFIFCLVLRLILCCFWLVSLLYLEITLLHIFFFLFGFFGGVSFIAGMPTFQPPLIWKNSCVNTLGNFLRSAPVSTPARKEPGHHLPSAWNNSCVNTLGIIPALTPDHEPARKKECSGIREEFIMPTFQPPLIWKNSCVSTLGNFLRSAPVSTPAGKEPGQHLPSAWNNSCVNTLGIIPALTPDHEPARN